MMQTRARNELAQAEDQAALAATADLVGLHADQLEASLRRLGELHGRAGGRPIWKPTVALYQLVRKAAAAAGLL